MDEFRDLGYPDETLSRVFDVASQTSRLLKKLRRRNQVAKMYANSLMANYPNIRHAYDFLQFTLYIYKFEKYISEFVEQRRSCASVFLL